MGTSVFTVDISTQKKGFITGSPMAYLFGPMAPSVIFSGFYVVRIAFTKLMGNRSEFKYVEIQFGEGRSRG